MAKTQGSHWISRFIDPYWCFALPLMSSRPFDVAPPIGYDYAYKQVGPAMRKHPGPRRHLRIQVMQVVLYYSQTRSRQEAGLFGVRG